MSGMIIQALPRTDFDFSSLAVSVVTGKVPLATGVDLSQYPEATLILRIHTITMTNGAKFDIFVHPSAPTAEDPGATFRATTSALSVSSITVTTGATAPTLIEQAFAANIGGMVDVMLQVTQSNPVSNPFRFAISIDIAAKS